VAGHAAGSFGAGLVVMVGDGVILSGGMLVAGRAGLVAIMFEFQ